jgi:hypothetical protein
MMLAILAEAALRSLLLGVVVWIGLNLLRVRNPHVHMTCWLMVLVASLSMPFLMHWAAVSITLEALPVSPPQQFWPAVSPLPEAGLLLQSSDPAVPVAAHAGNYHTVNWLVVATAVLRNRRRHAAAATGSACTDVAPGARRKAVACP